MALIYSQYVGKFFKTTSKSGEKRFGILEKVDGDILVLRKLDGGILLVAIDSISSCEIEEVRQDG
jgi:hypothetical protein